MRGWIRSVTFLLSRSAQVPDDAFGTIGGARLANISTVQDQPVMRVEQELLRNALHQFTLDDQRCLAYGETGSVTYTENMRIHGHRGLAKGGVQDDIGRFTSNAR